MLGELTTGVAETSPAIFAIERLDFRELDRVDRLDHELRDPIAAVHLVRGHGIQVDEQHLELVAVSGVDETGTVQQRHTGTQRQPRSGQHETRVADGDRDGDTGGHERPSTARGKHGVLTSEQIEPGIAGTRVRRQRQVGIEPEDGQLKHGHRA
jgi:hypothetical protein